MITNAITELLCNRNYIYIRMRLDYNVALLENETRKHNRPSYSLPMCLHGMYPSYTLASRHPHQSRLELRIPCLAIMFCVVYFLFSFCGILINTWEVLLCLGGGMGRYLDIAIYDLKLVFRVHKSLSKNNSWMSFMWCVCLDELTY